ncbi:MAG: Fic family protein [Bacilli bacterium]|jgi:Fic family protein
MLKKLKDDEIFCDEYLKLFAVRFIYGNLLLEDDKVLVSNPKRAIEVYNHMQALKYCLNMVKDKNNRLTPYQVQRIHEIINKDINFFPKGYRKTKVIIGNNSFIPEQPSKIPLKVMCLFDNYYNTWTFRDVFEKEALFHLGLVRIQPFEDVNKRTATIATNYNLLNQGYAPIIIDNDYKDKYFNYLFTNNSMGLAKLLERSSQQELLVMRDLCNRLNPVKEKEKII